MKHSLGLFSIGTIAIGSMIALCIQAGCATDDPAEPGSTGGGTTGGTGGAAGSTGGTAGSTGGTAGATGGSAGSGGSASCAVGKSATIADVANGTVAEKIQVDVKGAIATTKKLLVYFGKEKGTCLWGLFVRDPKEDRGMMVVDYGDNAPENSKKTDCPTGTDSIPNDVAPGDILEIVGETAAFAPATCKNVEKQKQIKACSVKKVGAGTPPAPFVVTDLDGLAAGKTQYQGLLVRIENVVAENNDGGTVGPFGVIQLQGTELQVNDNFYYNSSGDAPSFDPSQQFKFIDGISHLMVCDWVLQPRNKCDDFDPSSKDCS